MAKDSFANINIEKYSWKIVWPALLLLAAYILILRYYHTYFTIIFTTLLYAVFSFCCLLFARKLGRYQRAVFLILGITSIIYIIRNILAVTYINMNVYNPNLPWVNIVGQILFFTVIIGRIAAWVVILAELMRSKHKCLMFLTGLPIVLTALYVLAFYAYNGAQYVIINNITYSMLYFGHLQIIFYIVLILCLSCARSPAIIILILGFFTHFFAAQLIPVLTWHTIYSGYNSWAITLVLAKLLMVAGVISLLNSHNNRQNNIWFNSVDSVSSQVTLWGNSIASLLIALQSTYHFDVKYSKTMSLIIFQEKAITFVPFIILFSLASLLFSRLLSNPFSHIAQTVDQLSVEKNKKQSKPIKIKEFRIIERYIVRILNKIKLKTKTEAVLLDETSKMAHDIRSPLSVLQILGEEMKDFFEPQQKIVFHRSLQQIQMTSQNFLNTYRNTIDNTSTLKGAHQQEIFVAILLEETINEKKVQYIDSTIEFHQSIEDQAWFSLIYANPQNFKRVLSNLINNAVEASLSNSATQIECRLSLANNNIQLEVIDQGCGMTPKQIQQIKIRQATTTKKKGSGIGLKFVTDKIKQWKGEYEIESSENKGTRFIITLPQCSLPNWFVSTLPLAGKEKIVILDDEKYYHEQWEKRLQDITATVTHCYSCAEFINALQPTKQDTTLYLIDYQLASESRTGIDIILQNELNTYAILTTNAFGDKAVRQQCQQNNIALLPKPLIKYVADNL